MSMKRFLTPNSSNETHMNTCAAGVKTEVFPHQNPLTIRSCDENDLCSPKAFILTTDLNSGNDAQDRAATYGIDLQIRFPKEGWPTTASVVFIALDELMLDARDRWEYLTQLQRMKLPFPVIVLSYDFEHNPPTVVGPGLTLAVRLDHEVFCALQNARIDMTEDTSPRRPDTRRNCNHMAAAELISEDVSLARFSPPNDRA